MLVIELKERFDREEDWGSVIEKKDDNVSHKAKCYDPKDDGPKKFIGTTIFENLPQIY